MTWGLVFDRRSRFALAKIARTHTEGRMCCTPPGVGWRARIRIPVIVSRKIMDVPQRGEMRPMGAWTLATGQHVHQ